MKRKKLVVSIFILILLVSVIFLINYWRYYQINKDYVGNGILLNIVALVSNFIIGILGFKIVSKFEKNGDAWLLFVSSPIWVVLLVVLLKTSGVSVDGHIAWLNIGPFTIHYLQLLLYLLFLSIPVGIDGLIKENYKYEEIVFSIISFVNTFLMVLTKDIQGTIWCSMFILLYYFFKRRITIMPINVSVIPTLCGVIYGFFDKSSLSIYEIKINKQAFKYVYRYPLISMQDMFSGTVLFFVIVLYILISYLLGMYIKMYVADGYKQRARFLYIVMIITWILHTIYDLKPFDTLLYGNAAFSTSESFVWLVPILTIFMLEKKNSREYIRYNCV